MKKYLWTFSILILANSCAVDQNREPGNSEPAYFPLKEFIEVQAKRLDQKGISKLVEIKGTLQKVEEKLSEEEWLLELDLFLQADINKSALGQSYDIHRSEEYLIHELKPGENGKIKKLVFRYEGDQVKEISFQAETDNMFYNSKTRGVLYTHSKTGLLEQINIEAIQKVVFLTPNKMVIKGSVIDL